MNLTSIAKRTAAAAIAMAAAAAPGALAQDPNGGQAASPVQAVAGAAQQITLTMGKGELY